MRGIRSLVIAGVLVGAIWSGLELKSAFAQPDPQAPEAMPASVKIDNFSFGPAELKIQAGTTVKWTNHDDIPHTVVSTDGVFKSRALDTDESFSYKFEKPGTYPYFCSLHPKMTGRITVQ